MAKRSKLSEAVFSRNLEASELLDRFFVSAITGVLLIRFLLHITDYPFLGGGNLHIAHMLLGGFFMLVALVMLLVTLSRPARHLGAVVGGLGFGIFIDELGKFIISDNNYFFEPTAAILYALFILIYLGFRALKPPLKRLSPAECLINTLEMTKDAVVYDFSSADKRRAEALLRQCADSHPLKKVIADYVARLEFSPLSSPGLYARISEGLRFFYWQIVDKRWFSGAVIFFFIASSLLNLGQTMFLVRGISFIVVSLVALGFVAFSFFRQSWEIFNVGRLVLYIVIIIMLGGLLRLAGYIFPWPDLTVPAAGELIFSMVSGLLVLCGVWRLGDSRLLGYKMFERAVLVTIFLTEFFTFYQNQFFAVFGLAANIIVLEILKHWIREEERQSHIAHNT